jgi:hypothetical protein
MFSATRPAVSTSPRNEDTRSQPTDQHRPRMSTTQNPTYFLSPNWTFRPGGRIALGNIIVDPLKPHLYLSQADPPPRTPETESTVETNWRLSVDQTTGISLRVWAVFLDKILLDVGLGRELVRSHRFTMTSLETITLRSEPTPDELHKRCNDSRVSEFMRRDSVLCRPVYMVTGLKIARGFVLDAAEAELTRGVKVELGAEVLPEVSVGAGIDVSRNQGISDHGFESQNDIVFAYQVVKIKPTGWKGKRLAADEFKHRQQLLDDTAGEVDTVEGDEDLLGEEDLEDADVVHLQDVSVAYSSTARSV